MPDVKMWVTTEVAQRSRLHPVDPDFESRFGELVDSLASPIAVQMSCYVPSEKWGESVEYYSLQRSEIDFTVFDLIVGPTGSDVIVEIAAYDFDDRMANIEDRLKNIAATIHKALKLTDEEHVAMTFFPVRQGCWVKV